MLRMSKQKATQIDQAKRYLKMHGDEIRKKYAVEGSAVGYKIKDGKYTDTVALIFYVKKKKSNEELLSQGISPIPEKIDGIPTDIVVMSKGFQPR
jgi:endonuclease G